MKRRKTLTLVTLITLMFSLFNIMPVGANPPYPEDPTGQGDQIAPARGGVSPSKNIDQPNPLDLMKIRAREALLKQGKYPEAAALDKLTAKDDVLVILVEYAGTDKFTWTPAPAGTSNWDPIGKADPNEYTGTVGDCSAIPGIPSVATEFTYGPTLHNQLPRPLSAADASGDTIWTPNFSKGWYNSFMFGNGVVFDYDRVDNSHVHEDFTGKSVVNYYHDMSGGAYDFSGNIVGWIQLDHSAWWYGADTCPGARSGVRTDNSGAIPGAGSSKSLVTDSLAKVEELRAAGQLGSFNWKDYDTNGDGVIDRLWIVHAGYGEEDNGTLLNRTDYGEAAMWSHSSSVTPLYTIPGQTMKAGPYIMMPENGGIGVFAHEYGHNLGADDLYAYNGGETSAGFWTLMADDWVGYPLGYQPPAVDPWHLDRWGWLNPQVISDTSKVYTVTLGQASSFPGGTDVKRGVKIALPDGEAPLPVVPKTGTYNWWGGKQSLTNAMMTLKTPIAIPAGGAHFSFDMAYDIEQEWDYLWVQASVDGGTNWNTLTNADTICTHVVGWVGELYGFPEDLCAAGIGGFSGFNANFPAYDPETFTLDAATYGGKNVTLRFWYMTDWGTEYAGPFIDNISVDAISPAANLFSDGAETDGNWTFAETFQRTNGFLSFSHNLYLQWRNTSATGGYDAGLGDPRFRYGPVGGGLLVWYNNNYYGDNEVASYLTDYPSYGPKGRMLVVDANPNPVRSPAAIAAGYNNEGGNWNSRGQMRDAAFNQNTGPNYTYGGFDFAGKPAVPFFDDSLGYYPGSEFVSRGSGYPAATAKKWVTKQWDASVVVPATGAYPLNALGYIATDEFRFDCTTYPGSRLSCSYNPSGLGYAGGTGNPGDYGVQFGWHVDILSQTDTTATVKIWNIASQNKLIADTGFIPNNQTRYSFNHINQTPTSQTVFACVDLDITQVRYISGNNVLPLTAPCASASRMALMGGSLSTSVDPSRVMAVAVFAQDLMAGGNLGFDFTVQPLRTTSVFHPVVSMFENGIHRFFNSPIPLTNHYFWPLVGK